MVSLERRRKYLEKQEQLLLYYIHIGKRTIQFNEKWADPDCCILVTIFSFPIVDHGTYTLRTLLVHKVWEPCMKYFLSWISPIFCHSTCELKFQLSKQSSSLKCGYILCDFRLCKIESTQHKIWITSHFMWKSRTMTFLKNELGFASVKAGEPTEL